MSGKRPVSAVVDAVRDVTAPVPSLYLHIPFCRARCDYCDFFTRTGVPPQRRRRIMERIVEQADAAVRPPEARPPEIRPPAAGPAGRAHHRGPDPSHRSHRREPDPSHRSHRRGPAPHAVVPTIYVGGGTPSALSDEAWDILLAALDRWTSAFHPRTGRGATPVTVGPNEPLPLPWECTVEVNPEDVTRRMLDRLTAAGVNRLSVGIQSLDETLLARIGRHVSAKDTRGGLALIAEHWPHRWSADIITAIPGQTVDEARRDVAAIVAFRPGHVSRYELSVEPGTRLAHKRARGLLPAASDDDRVRVLETTRDALETHGLLQYETSNFALPGRESAHNIAYWEMRPWNAAGPGSVALVPHPRGAAHQTTPGDFRRFLHEPAFGVEVEALGARELLEEFLMGGFRMTRGVSRSTIQAVFGVSLEQILPRTLDGWHNRMTRPTTDRLALDATGALLLDRFLVDAFGELDATAPHLIDPPRWPHGTQVMVAP